MYNAQAKARLSVRGRSALWVASREPLVDEAGDFDMAESMTVGAKRKGVCRSSGRLVYRVPQVSQTLIVRTIKSVTHRLQFGDGHAHGIFPLAHQR